jgi:branched-chain amino acid transport system substrate-binding protein
MEDRKSFSNRALRGAGVLAAAGAMFMATVVTAIPAGATTYKANTNLALSYTGGKAGKANAKLTPITIGYVNQQYGNPSYPEATQGAQLAVKYVNNQLGGIQGHPIKLSTCYVATEEDGQKCGTQFLNNPAVSLVLTGAMSVGASSMMSVLAGQKPIIVGNGLTAPDFTTKGAVTYTPGAPGVVEGLSKFVTQGSLGTVKSVAIVATTDAAAETSVKLLMTPILEAAGIKVSEVFVAPTTSGAAMESALKAAGASTADVFIPITPVQGCISVYDALKSLGIHPKVLTTGLCYGTPMVQALGGTFPNGWYFGGYGASYFAPLVNNNKYLSSSQTKLYENIVKQYNPRMQYTGFAGPEFGNVLTIDSIYNKLGPTATSAQLATATVNFQGPQWLVSGTPVSCGNISPLFPSICVGQMGIEQFKNGKWVAIADVYNNKLINPFAK